MYLAHRNYDQGLGRKEKWQLIPRKESAAKEYLASRKIQDESLEKTSVNNTFIFNFMLSFYIYFNKVRDE